MPARQKTLLCIDDETTGLMVRKLVLESAGYHVLTAADGPEGLRLFECSHVDAVILDYAMPQMNGGQVAQRMREINDAIPILLLSAFLDLPPEVLHIVDAYVTKGQPVHVLLDEVQTLLQHAARDSSCRRARNAA